jgi:uncharacterized protein YndB with AHSA1/START domain
MPTDTKTLQIKRTFDDSPEAVFDAWIDPDTARKFLFATPDGEIVRCDIDARTGGSFTITRRDNSGDTEHVGVYEVVDRPHKLVFTFGVPAFTSDVTLVIIDIASTPSGCALTFTQEGVWADWLEKNIQAWNMILDRLNAALKP